MSEDIAEMELTDWYRHWRRHGRSRGSSITICECDTEGVISGCDRPTLMRAFLFVTVSIDEAMKTTSGKKGTNGDGHYAEFRKHFGFPRIEPHHYDDLLGIDFVSPGWLIYEPYGRDKLMDWSLCAEVAETLFGSVHKWINEQANPEVSWGSFSGQLGWMVSTVEHYSPAAALRVTAALK